MCRLGIAIPALSILLSRGSRRSLRDAQALVHLQHFVPVVVDHLHVVVGVDEPAGDVVDGRAADLAGGGVVDAEAAELHVQLAVREGQGT